MGTASLCRTDAESTQVAQEACELQPLSLMQMVVWNTTQPSLSTALQPAGRHICTWWCASARCHDVITSFGHWLLGWLRAADPLGNLAGE